MSEVADDIRVNLVEAVSNLGINLSGTDTRIKHSSNGVFDITSEGIINISTGNEDVYLVENQLNGNLNIGSKDADSTITEQRFINIIGGKGSAEVDGSGIYIKGGDGLEGINSTGGGIDIIGGNGQGTGDGGQIRISSGFSFDGVGGDVYIEAGLGKYNPGGNSGGAINIQSGLGGEKCGDVNITLGPTYPGAAFGPSGRFKVNLGAITLPVFANATAREVRIPAETEQKGDICLLETSGDGANLIHYFNGTTWKALQTF